MKNRYEELIRVSCQMRNLQVQKRFGAVYGTSSSHGSLAIFCPSCPQPGINLSPDLEGSPKLGDLSNNYGGWKFPC
jgi:hypothetical protein